MKRQALIAAAAILAFAAAPAAGQQHGGSHADPTAQAKQPAEASGVGVIEKIDAAGGKITITHEPMPELGWPKMTMDLPVTRRVDLSTLKPGQKIGFKLKQGMDKHYRIIAVTPAK